MIKLELSVLEVYVWHEKQRQHNPIQNLRHQIYYIL